MSLIMKAEVMKCKSPELKQALMKAKDVCAPPEDGPANPVCAAALKMVGGMSKNKDTKDKASMTPEDKKMVMEMCKQFNGMSQTMKAEVMKCKSPELKQALMKAKDVGAPPGHGGKGSGSGGKKPDGGKGSGSGGKKPEDGPANPVCAAALKMVGGMSKNKDTKDKASMTPEDKKMVMEMCKQFNG